MRQLRRADVGLLFILCLASFGVGIMFIAASDHDCSQLDNPTDEQCNTVQQQQVFEERNTQDVMLGTGLLIVSAATLAGALILIGLGNVRDSTRELHETMQALANRRRQPSGFQATDATRRGGSLLERVEHKQQFKN